jgi:hypothetical protein
MYGRIVVQYHFHAIIFLVQALILECDVFQRLERSTMDINFITKELLTRRYYVRQSK